MMTTTVNYPKVLNLLSQFYLHSPVPGVVHAWRTELSAENDGLTESLKRELDIVVVNPAGSFGLETEYARLFVGPASLACPPWESMYSSPGKQMMQEAYEQMGSLYLEAGLIIDSVVLADHIGAQLKFLALLLERTTEPEPIREQALCIADRLLDEHLNRWAERFTRDLEVAARSPLYKALATTTRETLAKLQA